VTLGARRKFLVLLVASITSSLIMLDTNIVAVSLPTIARDLHAGFAGIEWVISAYIITFAALLLPAGSIADLHGRRLAVTIGLSIFLVASAICGLATTEAGLEAARAAQGIGAALLLTSALAIISSTFSGAERQKAYAFWASCLGIAMTSGPIVGGLVTGFFGWRWAFLINLPICIGLLVATPLIVPESKDPSARRFDWFGVATLTAGLFAFTWALIDGNTIGWSSLPIVSALVAAALLLGAFVVIERLQTRPMLEMGLFRNRNFVGAAFGMAGYGAGAQVMVFFLPIYLQSAFGYTPEAAGLAMLPFAIPLFVAPRVAASLLAAWSQRSALALALGIAILGNLLLAWCAFAANYWIFTIAMLVAGIGTGILNPETAKAMQNQVPPGRAGMGSGVSATTRFTSLLVGVAALGAVMVHSRPALAAVSEANSPAGFSAVALAAACIAGLCLFGSACFMTATTSARSDPRSAKGEASQPLVGVAALIEPDAG
jgi:EmrB/QacA subfamily drug resistance transporter